MKRVYIGGERFYADLIGVTPSRKLACLGFIGKRTGCERALILLHKGANKVYLDDDQAIEPLGEKSYRVSRTPLPGLTRLSRIYVVPSTALHHIEARGKGQRGNGDDEDKPRDRVLLWRKREGLDEQATLWSWLKEQTAIPVLDAWRDCVLGRLKQMRIKPPQTPAENESSTESEPLAIQPIEFPEPGDGLWDGAVVNINDELMADAVQSALRAGEAQIPNL